MLQELRQARERGVDLRPLVERYWHLIKSLQARLKEAILLRAEECVREIEELKHVDPAESWGLLKRLTGLDGGSSPPLATVVDKNGVETRGEQARSAVREAYHALGVENLDDPEFDADFHPRGGATGCGREARVRVPGQTVLVTRGAPGGQGDEQGRWRPGRDSERVDPGKRGQDDTGAGC